ncbi:Growth-regulating factor [Trema orientale]|uniref:Growth-regulating factor n=1 Tax=Trema orientale TaxID=63057 RepID=A0A2P5AMM3_TREOI|nr:Growth-regulating factor [Trema orientale]
MEFQTNPSHFGRGGGEEGGDGGVRKRYENGWTVGMHGGKRQEAWPLIKREQNSNSGFTSAQLQELQHQNIIYRHIVARLPVPPHLVVPIWKSVASTLGASFYNLYPSFIGFSPQGFDRRNMMDPEPSRCRRTDGKKWRCSRNVIPDHKYCEQHIHRGRQRSRKLVEDAEVSSSPSIAKIHDKSKGGSLQNSNSNISVSVGLQLMTTSSSNNTGVSHGSTTPSSSFTKNQMTCVTAPYITTNTAAISTNTSIPVTTGIKSDHSVSSDVSERYFENNCIIRGSNYDINVGRNLSQGLGFSPRSVLQGCSGLCTNYRNGIKLEPGRCRRTDGKKWQCSRDVVPDQKYCARHMHRGAKKLVKGFPPAASSAASSAAIDPSPLPLTMAVSCKIDHVSPNTNLSISIPASLPLINKGEKSNSSSSSDTTVSDTGIIA